MQHEIHLSDFNEPIGVLEPVRPLCVEAGSPLRTAIDMLDEENYGCVVVVRKKKIVGILTEHDILTKVAGQSIDLDQATVDTFMTRHPVCMTVCDSIKDAIKAFRQHNIRHIPIVDKRNHPVGYTSVRGVIDFVVSYFSEEVLNLPPKPMRVGMEEEAGA